MGLFDIFRRRVKEVTDDADAEALTTEEGSAEAERADEWAAAKPVGPAPTHDPTGTEEHQRVGTAESVASESTADEAEPSPIERPPAAADEPDDEWDDIDDGITPSPFDDRSAKALKERRKQQNKRGMFGRRKGVEKTEVARPAGSHVDLNVMRSTTGRRLVEVAAVPRGSSGPTTIEIDAERTLDIDLGGGVVETGGRVIRQSAALDELIQELESILLEADMGGGAIDLVLGSIRTELIGRRLRRGADLGHVIEASLKRSLRTLLAAGYWDFDATTDSLLEEEGGPVIIMLVGVNGTGKTTTAAKLAHRFTAAGKQVVLAAADTFRAGAIEQLEVHAERIGVRCISSQRGGDSAAIARDAIDSARARGADVVIIDTAGRMQNKSNLMEELRKVHRVTKPHLVLFVGDALAGNDAVEQAVEFQRTLAFDGFVLCKLDTDAKGGAALSIAHATGRPIVMVGVGQGYDDLQRFDPDRLLEEMFA